MDNLNVRNGMLATVEKVGDEKISVLIDNEDKNKPTHVTFLPSQFSSIDHGYAVTVHRSQGSTVDRSFVLSSETLDDNLTYVALTRHKQQTRFYTAPEIALKHERNSIHMQKLKRGNYAPDRKR